MTRSLQISRKQVAFGEIFVEKKSGDTESLSVEEIKDGGDEGCNAEGTQR